MPPQKVTQEVRYPIPAALVRLKWQNRREMYALQVKKFYGATINAIIEQHPELRDKYVSSW